tara:strand:- start:401 stop:643 length:243 start_codon:yes stop_codon:yes gene_type:complete
MYGLSYRVEFRKKIDHNIEIAWEDHTPFDAIFYAVWPKKNAVRGLMRKERNRALFILWRIRVKTGTSSTSLCAGGNRKDV